MKHFVDIVQIINNKIDLPQPIKSRIILEIFADLEDLYLLYIQKGSDPQEAAQKAKEKIDLSDDALDQLTNVHQSPFRKFIFKFSEQAQTLWERLILLILFFVVTIAIVHTISTTPFLNNASPFVYPLIALFIITILIVFFKVYQIYIKKDHDVNKLRNGMEALLSISVIGLFIGVFGYFIELLYSGEYALLLETKLSFLIITQNPNFNSILLQITNWTIRSSEMMMICFSGTIFSALAWFFLINKIINIEQAEVEYLLKQ